MNHLQYYPNYLTPLTAQGFLYASTAEGFFAVSGIVLGIVRGRKLKDKPLRDVTKLLWKRALQLYLTSIALTVLFTIAGQYLQADPGLKYGVFTDWAHWPQFVFNTLTLSYNYSWADFLRYYTVFLLVAPGAIWLLRKGLWYVLGLLIIGAWSLYPFFASTTNNISQPISWQIIFFGGFAVGYYWHDILRWWRALPIRARQIIKVTWFAVFLVTLLTSFALVFGHTLQNDTGVWLETQHHIIEQHFNKDRMPLERIALGIVWFWGIFIFFRRFESIIKKWLGWLLYAFGTHSLYVYTVSAIVIFCMHLFVPAMSITERPINLALSMFGLAIVWLALRYKVLLGIIPK